MSKGKLIVRPLPPPDEGQPIRTWPEWTWRDTLFWAVLFIIPGAGIGAIIVQAILIWLRHE